MAAAPAQHAPSSLTAIISEHRAVSPPGIKSPRHPNTFPPCSHSSELLPGSAMHFPSACCMLPKLQWWWLICRLALGLGCHPRFPVLQQGHKFSAADTGHQLILAHASAACRVAMLEAWQNQSCLSQRAHQASTATCTGTWMDGAGQHCPAGLCQKPHNHPSHSSYWHQPRGGKSKIVHLLWTMQKLPVVGQDSPRTSC